jgi:hypothetical protein
MISAREVTKVAVLQNMNPWTTEPEWCLPPFFWQRAAPFKGYEVYPLGAQVGMPIKKCHESSLTVMANRDDTPLEYCTGYAYGEGTYTRHSWVVHQGDKILLETTPAKFEEYFGVVLTSEEFEQFKEMMA